MSQTDLIEQKVLKAAHRRFILHTFLQLTSTTDSVMSVKLNKLNKNKLSNLKTNLYSLRRLFWILKTRAGIQKAQILQWQDLSFLFIFVLSATSSSDSLCPFSSSSHLSPVVIQPGVSVQLHVPHLYIHPVFNPSSVEHCCATSASPCISVFT